jgi:oligosaccharide repeat unit polymerase
LSFLSDGGRSVMIQLFISLCILLFYYRKKISKKNKKKIMYSILIIGILTSLLTIERGVNLLENFYTYYAGSLVFFSKSLDMNYLFNSTFLYGVNGFQGIFRPIFGILNIFGIQDFSLLSKANSFLMDCQNTVFYVSPNIKMNYFITCFGYMYKDFGILGLIVESFIFGAIMSRFKIEKGNIYKISCFILFAQGILFSMSIIPFASYNFIMAFVYIYIITYNFKKKLRIKT